MCETEPYLRTRPRFPMAPLSSEAVLCTMNHHPLSTAAENLGFMPCTTISSQKCLMNSFSCPPPPPVPPLLPPVMENKSVCPGGSPREWHETVYVNTMHSTKQVANSLGLLASDCTVLNLILHLRLFFFWLYPKHWRLVGAQFVGTAKPPASLEYEGFPTHFKPPYNHVHLYCTWIEQIGLFFFFFLSGSKPWHWAWW